MGKGKAKMGGSCSAKSTALAAALLILGCNADLTDRAGVQNAPEAATQKKQTPGEDPGRSMLDAVAARQAKARELLAAGKAALIANKPAEAAGLFRKALELAPDLTEASQQLEFAQGMLGADRDPVTRLERRNRIRRQMADLDMEKALRKSSELLARARKVEDFQASANAAQVAMDILVTNKALYTPKSYRDWRVKIERQLEYVPTQQKKWERVRPDHRIHQRPDGPGCP